ncbi:3838_t:CDS:2 [Funneliformis mosseae]|uniref:3838_t:CDS:1 n=1 Tax=Funneliformis mosseae TaxID=27381 RepID=A0A9N9HA66_FUNMO|nr:3838_t:CDS:2 [Funneliformis mosseae]
MYNAIMLDWIRDNLKDLKPEDFYKAFNFSHTSRRFAEEKLRELLVIIKDENNSTNRRRAICLLDSFEAWTQSTSCELYWLSVEASLGRASHEVIGRNLAYETIKTIKYFTRKINEEASLNEFQPPTKKIKKDKPEQQTPENKIKTFSDEESAIPVIEEDEESSSSSESGITPVNLSNIFLATSIELEKNPDKKAESNVSLEEVKMVNKKPRSKYIARDIAKEVLETYQVRVLANEKLTYNGVDVLDFIHSTKGIEKSPLSIGVINFYNAECTKYIPHDFKQFISNQLQDPEVKTVNFSEGKGIDKFLVDCDDDVLQFLNKFDHVSDLDSLGRCLDENLIGYYTSSNDLIYVQNLFTHFFHLYKNDILLQSMSEHEFSAYVWTPLLRNAFLGKTDLKLSCGELASKSYDKLKEILNIAGRSAPKLDGKGFLKSLGTELLAQEDGVLNTRGKKNGDLRKLEYCTKVILTALFFALPSTSKDNIKDIEVYSLQSNGFCLTISTSKYLFDNTIVTMDLQDIEVPRTVEGFSKLILAVKIILSWKARTKKNTDAFYQALNEGHRRITKGVFFSPKKISI